MHENCYSIARSSILTKGLRNKQNRLETEMDELFLELVFRLSKMV